MLASNDLTEDEDHNQFRLSLLSLNDARLLFFTPPTFVLHFLKLDLKQRTAVDEPASRKKIIQQRGYILSLAQCIHSKSSSNPGPLGPM